MNAREADILINILNNPFSNQRSLAEETGYSLGIINRTLHSLAGAGFLDDEFHPTAKAREAIGEASPRNAVILAAGFGMRMVPINLTAPKAMLEVHGEALIERQIRQLQEAGIRDITVVVGFMKESFEELIDRYGVKLIVNREYAHKNNLSSLALTADKISNTYIIPADVWCRRNPFSRHELYSWYMVTDTKNAESTVRLNRKMELAEVTDRRDGNTMIGISYLTGQEAKTVRERIRLFSRNPAYDQEFWESALYENGKMIVHGRLAHAADVVEINTYEQLRELDGESSYLKSDALDVIAEVFHTSPEKIVNIEVLKKGMTNRSFLFTVDHRKYIMRIPGEGTNELINREQEAEVFRTISGCGLCDDPVYLNPENGYKITLFLDEVRVCDPESEDDQKKCINKLREFHGMHLTVGHTFDIFEQIGFYESLWQGQASAYRDYRTTKANVLALQPVIDRQKKDWCLTHIDAVPDNFLFYTENGEEKLQLTDWEYSGMQDPHVDIAMFCIYSLYDKEQTDHLIDLYFDGACSRSTRMKIYCYVAACGLLWSNWCEYKRILGVEFGEYSLRQYRYAKDFCRYAREIMTADDTEAIKENA